MSIKTIKTTLENYLNTNVTTLAIKWNNTSAYTLNGTQLISSKVNALTFFIEPNIIPIAQDRALMSSATPRRFEVFFQIDIYAKLNTGTGAIYTAIELLDAVFVEEIISGVTIESSKTLGSFESGEYLITPVRYLAYTWG
jgi:hypothetical protein